MPTSNSPSSFRVGLIGLGNIGQGLVSHLVKYGDLIEERLGQRIELTMVADNDLERQRDVAPPPFTMLTDDWREVVGNETIDLVVELVGVGRDGKPKLAYEIAKAALEAGKHFVTANKGLIATHGGELHDLAEESGAMLLYEASVGAGIPVISSIQNALSPNRLHGVAGLVNGTCNYILSQFQEDHNLTMERAIADAQEKGYAEPDPTFDVGGHDSAYKLVILASLAFGQELRFEDVILEGITSIGPREIEFALERGLVLKLLARARLHDDGSVEMVVAPHFLPASHVLAGVHDVFNAVLVEGDPIGETLYYGAGAGRPSTASGLIADIMLAARIQRDGAEDPYPLRIPTGETSIRQRDKIVTRHYLRFGAESTEELEKVILKEVEGQIVSSADGELILLTTPISEAAVDNLLGKLKRIAVPYTSITHVRFAFEQGGF